MIVNDRLVCEDNGEDEEESANQGHSAHEAYSVNWDRPGEFRLE